MNEGRQGPSTAPSQAEVVVVAPRSSGLVQAAQRRDSDRDIQRMYSVGSLPPPDIDPWDGSDVGERVPGSDPAEVLNRLTLGSNMEERERAKMWMRTACFHANNEAYWKERAGLEFARTERVLQRSGISVVFYRAACLFAGMGIFQWMWFFGAAAFCGMAMLFETKVQRESDAP